MTPPAEPSSLPPAGKNTLIGVLPARNEELIWENKVGKWDQSKFVARGRRFILL